MGSPTEDDVYFVFGSLNVGTSAKRSVQAMSWDDLYDSVPLRGGNEVMPGAPGRRTFELIPDEQEVTIFLQFNGRWDDDGDPTSGDPRAAASAALRAFRSSLNEGQPGETFEWHDYDVALGADVQYLGLKGTRMVEGGTIINTSLDLILPPTIEELGS